MKLRDNGVSDGDWEQEGRKPVATATVLPEARKSMVVVKKKSPRITRFNQVLVFLLLHHLDTYRWFHHQVWRKDGDMKISALVAMEADARYAFSIISTKKDHRHAGFQLF